MFNATLPAPRPGPTLDLFTQTPVPIVHKGWTIDTIPSGEKWVAYVERCDGRFSFTPIRRATREMAVADAVGHIDDMIAQDADPSAMPNAVRMSEMIGEGRIA
jgi:hypothetical protein